MKIERLEEAPFPVVLGMFRCHVLAAKRMGTRMQQISIRHAEIGLAETTIACWGFCPKCQTFYDRLAELDFEVAIIA